MKGQENVYVCAECHGKVRTRDVADGVTPMMIRCLVKEGCLGMMHSLFYRSAKFPQDAPKEPTHEWYKPTTEEIKAMPKEHRFHYENGGLRLRPIGGASEG